MKYLIIGIILLFVLLAVTFVMRRKHHAEIERLDNEKLQIQNKPILEEMTKVKQLNMNGQTEEMFERWRNSWNEIMDIHIPKVDDLLFDAEDMIDRFRYKKAASIEEEIQKKIKFCDEQMNLILTELHDLIGSEEKNRTEIEHLKEQHRTSRKTLLAHQHSFGVAVDALEKELEEFVPLFDEYDELTEHGDYLKAREIVLHLTPKGDRIVHLLQDIPSLLTEIQNKIPMSINELRNGQREMEQQSYYLQHLQLHEKLNSFEEELDSLKVMIAQLSVAPVIIRVQEIKDEIESFYDLLENEVHSKQYVDAHHSLTDERLTEVTSFAKEINDEATAVQLSYRLPEKEALVPQEALSKLESLQKRYEVLTFRVEEQQSAYSSLQSEIIEVAEEIEKLYEEIVQFADRLKNLREDENRAHEKLNELKKILQETDRTLHRANIPGIPEEMDARLEEAEEHVFVVMQSLQEVPLNMTLVENYLVKAEKCINEVNEKAEEMLENVILIEKIIQYGNRYRTSNLEMHVRLLEAEEAFRQYRYAKALEDAATAVEEFEPGAMKRIEVLVKEEVQSS